MSDINRKYPLMTPDTVRQKTHIDKSFFDLHTPKEKGYEHTNKTQYVGNVQNWGSELLLETRKLRQRKPPLGDVHIDPGMAHMFNIKYADEPSTYLQDCPIAISLKGNEIANRKMYFLFEECEPMYIPRPLDDGEVDTYKQLVWKTSVPPRLYREDHPGSDTFSNYYEINVSDDRKIADRSSVEVTYWFHNTSSVVDVDLNVLTDDERLLNRMLIEELTPYVSPTTGKDVFRIKTVNVEKWLTDVPLMWVTLSDRTNIPKFEMKNNVDKNGFPLLVPGIDGNGNYKLYPYLYGEDNIPPASGDEESSWAIRVFSTDSEEFKIGSSIEENGDITLSKIQFVRYRKDGNPYNTEDHYEAIDLFWDRDKMRLTINNIWIDSSIVPYGLFVFRKRAHGDWDYDGVLYNNPVIGTMVTYDEKYNCVVNNVIPPMFDIHLVKYDIYDWNWLSKNVNAGIHVDYTTDYSDNGVIKTNGTIFNYGDAKGLPPYFYYKLPRSIHRAHTELYLGRDSITDPNQNVENEQFVSLIIDAAIPQIEIETNIDDFDSVLVYAYNRMYHTILGIDISPNNAVSNIGYVSRELSADVKIKEYKDCDRFIYHGHRTFSLDMMGLDPALEYGRVYISSNESIDYVNNGSADKPRAERTLARICDIPTDLSQLISIKYISPTLLIDPRYTRTEANFTKEDRDRVLQINNPGVFIRGSKDTPNAYPKLIYKSKRFLNQSTNMEYLTDKFPYYKNLDETITIEPYITTDEWMSPYGNKYIWSMSDSDNGFQVGDVLKGYIGGRVIRGVVKRISSDGYIHEMDDGGLFNADSEYNTDPITFPVQNITSRAVYIHLTIESRYSSASTGSEAVIIFLMDEEEWEGLIPTIDGHVDNIHALYKDGENLFITKWDDETEMWIDDYQLTGPDVIYNVYDNKDTRLDRGLGDVLIYTHEQSPIIIDNKFYDVTVPTGYEEQICEFDSSIFDIDGISYDDTIKQKIMNDKIAYRYDCYYSAYETATSGVSKTNIDVHFLYNYPMSNRSKHQCYPKYNAYLGWSDYDTPPYPCSYLVFDHMSTGFINQYGVEKQPNVFIYNPIATTYEKIHEVSNDTVRIENENPITFKDIDRNIVFDNGSSIILRRDVWKSTAFDLKSESTDKRVYRPNSEDDGGITDAPLKQIGKNGTIVARYKNGTIVTDGEQPTGAYKALSARKYPMYYSFDKVQNVRTNPTYFFRIDNEDLESLDGFKMIDQYTSNDISDKSIILFNGKLYAYKNNKWIKINRYD